MCANQACSAWLCCAAAPVPEPVGRRTTMGTETEPPSMKRSLAAWLTICSIASVDEIGELEFEDRPHAGQRRADRDAGAAEFGDRRVHHPILAEALDEIAGDLEGAAVDADVLAHQEDPVVRLHGDRHRLLNRLGVSEFADRACP